MWRAGLPTLKLRQAGEPFLSFLFSLRLICGAFPLSFSLELSPAHSPNEPDDSMTEREAPKSLQVLLCIPSGIADKTFGYPLLSSSPESCYKE
jgi:hypothetical protein